MGDLNDMTSANYITTRLRLCEKFKCMEMAGKL